MFRVARAFLPRKNSYSAVPLLNQYSSPKEIVVEFTTVSDNKERFQANEKSQKKESRGMQTLNLSKGTKLQNLLKESDGNQKEVMRDEIMSGPNEIVKALKGLAVRGNRSLTMLNSLCQALEKNPQYFPVSEVSDILFSFAKLSYRNEAIIKMLTKPIQQEMKPASPKTISSIIRSLGTLKYRDCQLLDALLKSLLQQPLDINASLQCLVSLSFLNYPCSYANSLAEFLSDIKELEFNQTHDFISFVWSCAILNNMQYISNQHLSNILSEHFLTKIATQNFHEGIQLKLLNIIAAAQMSHLKTKIVKKPSFQLSTLKTRNSRLLYSIIDTLSYIVPKHGYFKKNVDTGAGFYIDACCNLSAKKPLKQSPDEKDQSMIGILVLEYQDTCSDKTPTGIFAFKTRVLENQGYKVVIVEESEYPLQYSLSEKMEFLRQKMLSNVETEVPVKSTLS